MSSTPYQGGGNAPRQRWTFASALALAVTIALVGCNVTQGPNAGGTLSPQMSDDSLADLSASARVESALVLLEQGHAGEARAQLVRAIEQSPDTSEFASRLMRQLDEDPETLLGEDSFEYRVKPGESLSLLANRYLGDEFLFYALARYNGIDVPGRVPVGQALKIPIRPSAASAEITPEPVPDNAPATIQPTGIPSNDQIPTRDSVAGRIHVLRAEKLAQQGDVPAARERLELARQFVASDPELNRRIDSMEADLDRQEADFLVHQAKAALATGDTERAHQHLTRSVKLDPGRQDARDLQASTRRQLVDEYHRVALGHLNAGQECSAMDLWNRILDVEPGNQDAAAQHQQIRQLLEGRQQECVNV